MTAVRRWRKRGGSNATRGGVGGGVMLSENTIVDGSSDVGGEREER